MRTNRATPAGTLSGRDHRPARRRRPLRSLLLAASWHRRLLASLLAAIAVVAGLSAASPRPPATEPVVVTARDVDGGKILGSGDLVVQRVPAGSVPDHAYATIGDVPRRPLVAPKRAGVVLTDLDVIEPGLLAAYGSGLVAVPVRIADAGSLVYLRVGDRVDLLAAGTVPTGSGGGRTAGSAALVAADVPVLAVGSSDGADAGSGGLVLVAAAPSTARSIAAASVTSRLSVAMRPVS